MQWIKAIFISFFLMFNAVDATAGGGHYHGPVSKEQAERTAKNVVSSLVRQNNLDQSWAQSPMKSIERIKLKGDLVWRAIFANKLITTPGEQNLNVFLTLTGGFITANYTGK